MTVAAGHIGVGLVVVTPVDQVFERRLEGVLVDVLLQEVLVVELLLEDGLVVELPDGQLLGGLEVELALGEVGLDRAPGVSPPVSWARNLLRRVRLGRDRSGLGRDRLLPSAS